MLDFSIGNPVQMDHSKSILIVEDNDTILNLLSKGFERFTWRVFKANNGLAGWDMFNREHVDIVLTDVQMPGINGIELSRKIREKSTEVEIDLMTGGDEEAASELLAKGMINYFFQKPVPFHHICEAFTAKM